MPKCFLFFLALIVTVEVLASSDRPGWTIFRPKPNKTHKFYVGRAAKAETEKQGIEASTQDARIQAIQENFGIETRVSKQVKETLSDTDYNKDYRETSAQTRIFGFEQLQIHSENNEDKKDVWVLFRYPKEEIRKEKKRQRKLELDAKKKVNFSTQGAMKDRSKGVLEVVTHPEDASVYIDGEPWGRTPLRLVGKLELGRHELVLEKDGFQNVVREIIITQNGVERIEQVMDRGFGLIKVETEPLQGAEVTINGKRAGLSPTDFFKVESGIPVKVEISHAEAFPASFAVELEINEKKTKSISLDLRPAQIKFSIFPRDAQVLINDESYSARDLRTLKVDPYTEYSIEVNREKYHPHEEEIALKGGEKKNINIRLKRKGAVYMTEKEIESTKKQDLAVLRESKYLTQYLSLGLSGSSTSGGDMGMGQMRHVDLSFSGYFTLRHNGRINGFRVEHLMGASREMPSLERKTTAMKTAVLLTHHPNSVESWTTGSPPRLKPITGLVLAVGGGMINGIFTEKRDEYKFTSFFAAARIGYDWRYFYTSAGANIYKKLPSGDHSLELGTEFLLSAGVRLKLGW